MSSLATKMATKMAEKKLKSELKNMTPTAPAGSGPRTRGSNIIIMHAEDRGGR